METYPTRPALAVEIASAAEYFRATNSAEARGRDAGTALGADPGRALAEIAAHVIRSSRPVTGPIWRRRSLAACDYGTICPSASSGQLQPKRAVGVR